MHKLINQQDFQRLDVFISSEIDGLSRKKARELCEKGEVLVAGKKSRPGTLLKKGDEVELKELPVNWVPGDERAESKLDIIFEDDSILLLNKQREMHSVRVSEEEPVTVADLLANYSEEFVDVSEDKREAGLLQRLDYYTSGTMLAAKNRNIWHQLREQFSEKRVKKTYLALIEGSPKEEFLIDNEIEQTRNAKKVIVTEKRGSESLTKVVPIVKLENETSIVRATSTTGKRHQIRAHLSNAGHPLCGDFLYGAKSESGFFLHAETLEFRHPETKEKLLIEAESEEFNKWING